jgi:hypothetical protein
MRSTILEAIQEALRGRAGASARVTEMLMRGRVKDVREALGSDVFDSLTLDVAHKAALKGYTYWPRQWQYVAKPMSVADFKAQYRISGTELADLAEVPANSPYKEVAMTDAQASYSVKKYGGVFSVSLEATLNDDLRILGQVAEKWGRAAARTIDRFVLDTNLNDNPTITIEGTAAALASTTFANNVTGALTPTPENVSKGVSKMLLQTAQAPEAGATKAELFLMPRTLLCHPDNWVLAQQTTKSALIVMGVTGTEAASVVATRGQDNPIRDFNLVPVVTPFISTTGEFWLLADPMNVDMFEIGFLNGRQEPELFREAPNSGYEFSHDAVRVKSRIIFGGAWLNFRGVVRCTT